MKLLRVLFLTLAATLPAAAADNTPPEGFVALFNGKDLEGWKGHIDMSERAKVTGDALVQLQAARDKLKDETWSVRDGVIHHVPKVVEVKGKQRKTGCSLQTVKDYGDFELLVDWKIEKAGDSGLYLRGQPQVQIWDSENLAASLKADWHTGSGGLWNNPLPKGADPKSIGKVPLKKADKPVGEWNTFRIVMKGDKVTIHLNGELVVDNAPLANYWEKGKPLPATGPIELQYHGDKLWFKNIYIRELK
ncbi:MAG TPA: DUF1080 domain-containing protein [Gemmataceae bacterium]|nr:DUF1080 domain-containing protein [Gemmataceae bacterium]